MPGSQQLHNNQLWGHRVACSQVVDSQAARSQAQGNQAGRSQAVDSLVLRSHVEDRLVCRSQVEGNQSQAEACSIEVEDNLVQHSQGCRKRSQEELDMVPEVLPKEHEPGYGLYAEVIGAEGNDETLSGI